MKMKKTLESFTQYRLNVSPIIEKYEINFSNATFSIIFHDFLGLFSDLYDTVDSLEGEDFNQFKNTLNLAIRLCNYEPTLKEKMLKMKEICEKTTKVCWG